MNSEQGIVQNSATRILQIDERRGPLLFHLNQNQWSMIKELFREAGGNPPAGWNIGRNYINNRSDYFLPVLLKDSNAIKSMFYRVSKDRLLYSCHMFKQQLQPNTYFPNYWKRRHNFALARSERNGKGRGRQRKK